MSKGEGNLKSRFSKFAILLLFGFSILLIAAIIFLISSKSRNSFKTNNQPIQQVVTNSNEPLESQIIDFTKRFANSYISGTAILNPEEQPVEVEYLSYLNNEKKRFLQNGISPLGAKVVNYLDSGIQPNVSLQNSYDVWLVIEIVTIDGNEKKIICAATVTISDGVMLIHTAGTIPFERFGE